MSTNFRTNEASDLLNLNMENISNELSALLVGGAPGGGAVGACGAGVAEMDGAVGGCEGGLDYLGTVRLNDAELLQYYRNHYYQQQLQLQQQQQQLQQQQHQQQQQLQLARTLYTTPAASVFTAPPPPLPTQPHSREAKAPEFAASNSTSSPPKFEFHYLRYQTFNKSKTNAEAVPRISSASYSDGSREHHGGCGAGVGNSVDGNGGRGFRKHQKSYQKYNNNHSNGARLEEVDYDKVVVDLSLIGLSIDNKEQNPVLRLFALFRAMHYYLNDVFPSGDGSAAEFAVDEIVAAAYNSTAAKTASMPCTMNVQHQVKQAARKCTIFLCDLQRILNANKLHDREMYLECERSLNGLRKLIVQFEMYKRVELEHKRGQFVTEEGRAQAERLELLMEQLNDKIRESHFYVHVFNWAMERKCVKAMNGVAASAPSQALPTEDVAPIEVASGGVSVGLTMPPSANGSGGRGAGGGANGRSAHLNEQVGAVSGTQSPCRYIG